MVNRLEDALQSASVPIQSSSHSLKSWEQIENQQEVAHIFERIQWATKADVYKCADLYDLAYPGYEGDKDYYLEKGKAGKVLYLGIGTGRIFSQLAANNSEAVGLDISPEMIDMLLKKNPLIANEQVMQADALTVDLGESKFDIIVAPYSFLQCFDDEDAKLLLENIQKWLKPGGKFHTDTFSPYFIPFAKKGLESSVRSIDDRVKIAIYVLYDHFNQKMKELALIERDAEPDHVLEMNLHYYFPHELHAMMQKAGLADPRVMGGYKGETFDSTENEIIVYETQKVISSNGAHKGNGVSKNNGNGRLQQP